MKKFKFLLIIFVLFLLVGCGSTDEKADNPEPDAPEKGIREIEESFVLMVGQSYEYSVKDFYNYENTNSSAVDINTQTNSFEAKAEGTATITLYAEDDEYKITAKYTITAKEEVITCEDNLLYKVGDKEAFPYKTLSSLDCTFTIGDESIIGIDSEGKLEAKKAGYTQVKLTSFNKEKWVNVEVIDTSNVLDTTKESNEVLVGNDGILNLDKVDLATTSLSDLNKNYTVTSSDPEVLYVTPHGMILFMKAGSATLTIKNNETTEENVLSYKIREEYTTMVLTDETKINLYGRNYKNKDNTVTFYHSGSGFECVFTGSELRAVINSPSTIKPCAYLKVYLDDTSYSIALDGGATDTTYTLATGLDDGTHKIKVVRRTEDRYGPMTLKSLEAKSFYTPEDKPSLKIEVYGDSITTGYGISGAASETTNTGTSEDATLTYAYVASEILNAQISMFCYEGMSLSIPGWYDDVMKDNFTYYALSNKKAWDFNSYVPDVIIIYMGNNDSYGYTSLKRGTSSKFLQDYRFFINQLLKKSPDAQIFCCYGILSMNSDLSKQIDKLPDLYTDGNVHTIKLSSAKSGEYGGNGHPNAVANERAGKELALYIEEVLEAKKANN